MKILFALLRLMSRLPFGALYVLSDVCFPILFYVVRYRRRVVRENIDNSFPELDERERRRIMRRYYRWFCDYVVETIKLLTIRPEALRRRMVMEGVEEMEERLREHPFVFIYLGHYCNWEWISSLPMWTKNESTHCGQLYRPLRDKAFDEFFLEMRGRFGAENISKYQALRHIVDLKRRGRKSIIGFISDQVPGWNSIHDWVDFLHQDTPVFTGTERIAKKVDADIYFADVRRERRGYYRVTFRPIADRATDYPDYEITERYMQLLESMIRRQPHLWLWSHRRWKHRRDADGNRIEG